MLSYIKDTFNVIIHINNVSWFLLTGLTGTEVVIVTLAKACIHKSRLKLIKPSLQMMKQFLRTEVKKEYIISQRNNCIIKFDQKWSELKKILE